MRTFPLALLLAIFLAGFGITACESTGPAEPKAEVQLPIESIVIRKSPSDDRQYAAIKLANELQVVLVSDPTVEVTAVSMGVGVGSYQDPDEHLGLAHYLEHMLFLGTEKYPEPNSFQKFVDQNAGVWNAFTSVDQTNYFFQLNAEKIDEAMDYFSDYFKKPTFDPEFSDKERNAVNSEWSMGRSQDNWIMYRLSGITANAQHPAQRLTVGNLDTLSDKPDAKLQEALLDFYARYYSANNMKLTIVGKQSIDELKMLVEKHFASIPNKNIVPPSVTVPGLTSTEEGKTIHYQSLKDLKQLMIEFPITDNTDQWRIKPNEFINSLITSEEPNTLGEQLRKKGLVNALYGYVDPDAYGADGYLRIIADLTDQGLANRDEIIAAIFSYVELVKKSGIEERYYRELSAMKKKEFDNYAKPQPVEQAIELTRKQFEYPVAHLLDADYVYSEFNKPAIESVLQQLTPERARIWHISKNEKADLPIPFYEGKYSIRDITESEYAQWQSLATTMAFELPPENPLFLDYEAKIVDSVYTRPELVLNEPGVEVWLAHAQHYREDKAYLEIDFNVDFATTDVSNYIKAHLLKDIFAQQTMTLVDRAARAGINIGVDLTPESSQAIRITGYSIQQVSLAKNLVDHFAQLTISEQDFAQVLDRFTLATINAKKEPPYKQLFAHARRLTRLANWTDDEILAAAKRITREDVSAYHARIMGDNLTRIFAFGNFEAGTVKAIGKYTAEKMQSKVLPENRYMMQAITPNPRKPIIYSEVVTQTDSALLEAWLGTEQSIAEQAQLMLLNGLLSNTLFTQLRTNEQMGYVVGSAPTDVNDYPIFMFFVQSTNTDLVGIKKRLDRFRKEFLVELERLDEAELAQLKKSEIAKLTQKPTDFSGEAREYLHDFAFAKYDFNSKQKMVDALGAVTKAEIIAIYEKLLLDQKGMHLLIQLKGTHFAKKPFAPTK